MCVCVCVCICLRVYVRYYVYRITYVLTAVQQVLMIMNSCDVICKCIGIQIALPLRALPFLCWTHLLLRANGPVKTSKKSNCDVSSWETHLTRHPHCTASAPTLLHWKCVRISNIFLAITST